jgi:pyruvate-ferredoxin/flavodoxin oxidoreductase
LDQQAELARSLLARCEGELGAEFVRSLLDADQATEAGIEEQRRRVAELKARLGRVPSSSPAAALSGPLLAVADALVRKCVWIVGGDGWAYDIGFGGLDHVLASGQDVNVLVLDTEVYSNTGGQMSKSTPRGAVAKFAASGKVTPKKDLAWMAMSYGTAYVARVAMGGNDAQTLQAFREAEAYRGPSLIIAFSHCVAHGYDLAHGMDQQKAAVLSGYWPLFRYHPERAAAGQNPLHLDSRPPSIPLAKYAHAEARYTMLAQTQPAVAAELLRQAEEDVRNRWRLYEYLAAMPPHGASSPVA